MEAVRFKRSTLELADKLRLDIRSYSGLKKAFDRVDTIADILGYSQGTEFIFTLMQQTIEEYGYVFLGIAEYAYKRDLFLNYNTMVEILLNRNIALNCIDEVSRRSISKIREMMNRQIDTLVHYESSEYGRINRTRELQNITRNKLRDYIKDALDSSDSMYIISDTRIFANIIKKEIELNIDLTNRMDSRYKWYMDDLDYEGDVDDFEYVIDQSNREICDLILDFLDNTLMDELAEDYIPGEIVDRCEGLVEKITRAIYSMKSVNSDTSIEDRIYDCMKDLKEYIEYAIIDSVEANSLINAKMLAEDCESILQQILIWMFTIRNLIALVNIRACDVTTEIFVLKNIIVELDTMSNYGIVSEVTKFIPRLKRDQDGYVRGD